MNEPGDSIICTGCRRNLTFADVLMLTPNVVALRCVCADKPLRMARSHSNFGEVMRRALIGWEAVAIPYVAAELPPLPCPSLDHKVNRFAFALLPVDTVQQFLERCVSDAGH